VKRGDTKLDDYARSQSRLRMAQPPLIDKKEARMSSITTAKEQLAADFQAVMSDVESLLAAGGAKAGDEADALRARIERRLETVKARVADAQHDAVVQARRAAQATDSFVHERPWQAMGIAAALGVALGVLIARR
jgi:ElaB/YqjD/DUF883 family membrane-anchored ribosome-binding protein